MRYQKQIDNLVQAGLHPYNASLICQALAGYLDCAEWLATLEDGDPINDNDHDGWHDSAISEALKRVKSFIEANEEDFMAWNCRSSEGESAAENFGHNLYLTEQGHGAGFWDRGQGELGDRLTAACTSGARDMYVFVDDRELKFS